MYVLVDSLPKDLYANLWNKPHFIGPDMSQLIHMRQRIKTVETIKRITHAMRLVARSSHFRLSKQQKALYHYHQRIASLFTKIRSISPLWDNARLNNPANNNTKLVILIGAHKELCGNFNTLLFSFFGPYIQKQSSQTISFVCIGEKAENFIATNYPHNERTAFLDRNPASIERVAEAITEKIFSAKITYSSVSIVSNRIKSFFIHYPFVTSLIPTLMESSTNNAPNMIDLTLDHNINRTLDTVGRMYITTRLQMHLFESLLAEQAARFLSMDNATRNADTILESSRLAYNKVRQAKITKDLIELSSSF